MPSQKPSKVIIDTNLWISFLIGKELQNLKDLIVSEKIQLITTDQLLNLRSLCPDQNSKNTLTKRKLLS